MPLFSIANGSLAPIQQTNFDREKQLQALVESSLQPIFNCRLVASEFSTGSQHGGRIDTLGLSEDNNPVIVEYKKVESSELINQSLFYLSWIHDHRGDFHVAAQQALGNDVDIDWSDVRVICIAPNYRKYDLHAVQVMGANLELWTYRLFRNDTIYFEEVFQKTLSTTPSSPTTKDPVMVAAGRKAALSRQTGSYAYEEHTAGKPKNMVELAETVRDFVMGLDPTTIGELPAIARDVREIGHYGTGDLELSIRHPDDFEVAKQYIELAYQNIGG